MPLSSSMRALAGRIGGQTTASRYDVQKLTSPAREAFLNRFLDQVDPDRILPVAERERRAEAARRAYFTRIALKSAVSRARTAERRAAARLREGAAAKALVQLREADSADDLEPK